MGTGKRTVQRGLKILKKIPRIWRRIALGVLIACQAFLLIVLIQFFWPRVITFSFAGNNCVTSPTLLPNFTSSEPSQSYTAYHDSITRLGGYPVYAHRTCVKAQAAPSNTTVETVKLSRNGLKLLSKNIRVTASKAPVLTAQHLPDMPLAIQEPMVFSLSSSDKVYEYQLAGNDHAVMCSKTDLTVLCDTNKLGLVQSTQYGLLLQRLFNGQVIDAVYSQVVTTVDALNVVSSSIKAGQVVYNTPTEMTLTFDKPVERFSGESLVRLTDKVREKVAITAEKDGATITIKFSAALPRSSSFELSFTDVTAEDGGYLIMPLTLPFTTSGGPKVSSVNIGNYKISTLPSITLTFDVILDGSQTPSDYARVELGGAVLAATVTRNSKSITIKPTAAMPRCTAFTVKVLDGIKSEFGITGGSAWTYKSRTICQTVFSIGSSVQNRDITGYSFGSGASKLVFVGNTHGNEKSSTYLLNKWVDTLEANIDRLPAHRKVIIIPNLNPDGYAANTRTNANGVDLNRNFPSNDWKQGVKMPDGSYLTQGGGSYGGSEPETAAFMSYINSQAPRLVLTYHAAGSVVSPNDSGDSVALAKTYADKSIVGYLASNATAGFFDYDLTGAMESWLHDKKGIPTLLVELSTKTSQDFSGHQTALWFIAQLP